MAENEMMKCPFCKGEVPTDVVKCQHCGEWVRPGARPQPPASFRPAPPAAPAPPSQPAPIYVNVTAPPPQPIAYYAPPFNMPQPPGSVAFAVVTLVLYLLFYPVGLLLNLIGLLTGPRRGCFLAMFLLFVIVPVAICLILMASGVDVGKEIERAFNSPNRSRY